MAAVQIVIVGGIVMSLVLSPRLAHLLRMLSGTSVGVLMLFYVFCGLSALWSPAAMYSLYRAIEVLGICMTVFAALNCLRSFQAVERLALGFAATMLAFDMGGTLKSGGLHANTYPMIAAMVLCYCWGELTQAAGTRKRMLLGGIICSIVALCLGTSASANVASLCGLLVIGIVRGGRFRSLVILVFAVLVLLLMGGYISQIQDVLLAMFFPGKTWAVVEGGHGRVWLWQQTWPVIMERPFLGHGFAAAARVSLGALSTHNSIMDIVLATGIVGLAIFGLGAVILLCELSRIPTGTAGHAGCCCVFVSAAVGSMGTSFLGNDIHTPMIAFASFAGLYVLQVAPLRRRATRSCFGFAHAQ